MNHMVGLFGDTFNKKGVTAVAGLNLKYVREDYRDNLQINHKYEHPPMVPEKEWKVLIEDEKEKELRKQGKTKPIGSRRYGTYHIFFKLLNIFKLQHLTYLQPFIGSPTLLKKQRQDWKNMGSTNWARVDIRS